MKNKSCECECTCQQVKAKVEQLKAVFDERMTTALAYVSLIEDKCYVYQEGLKILTEECRDPDLKKAFRCINERAEAVVKGTAPPLSRGMEH